MDREKVIRDNAVRGLQSAIEISGSLVHLRKEHAKAILELLKEQEESIPVSWLTEKLEGHPELPYAVTDGINNVLDLWEGR